MNRKTDSDSSLFDVAGVDIYYHRFCNIHLYNKAQNLMFVDYKMAASGCDLVCLLQLVHDGFVSCNSQRRY